MKNEKVRIALMHYQVRQWQLADALGITATTLSVKMRKERPEEEQMHMIELIKAIAEDRKRL